MPLALCGKFPAHYLIEILITALRGCYWHHSELKRKQIIKSRSFSEEGHLKGALLQRWQGTRASKRKCGTGPVTADLLTILSQRNEHSSSCQISEGEKPCQSVEPGTVGGPQPTQGNRLSWSKGMTS